VKKMIRKKLQLAEEDVVSNRQDIIEKMVEFAKTDSLLYWDTHGELAQKQEQLWGPILQWANKEINVRCKTTDSLSVPRQNVCMSDNLRQFLNSLSDKELAAFYLAAMNMHSELLAAALVKGKINAAQAHEAANLEELWQAEKWGKDPEAEKRRHILWKELEEIEAFLRP